MKKLLATVLTMFVCISMFGQTTLSKECPYFYGIKSKIKCELCYMDGKYFILMDLVNNKKSDIRLNDIFEIGNKYGSISLLVTEDILSSKNEKGLYVFPLDESGVATISKVGKHIYLKREGSKDVKFFPEYNSFKDAFEWIYKKLLMDQQMKIDEKVKNQQIIVKNNNDNKTKTQQKNTSGQKNYPSWRD